MKTTYHETYGVFIGLSRHIANDWYMYVLPDGTVTHGWGYYPNAIFHD